jgi:hypothetical protein
MWASVQQGNHAFMCAARRSCIKKMPRLACETAAAAPQGSCMHSGVKAAAAAAQGNCCCCCLKRTRRRRGKREIRPPSSAWWLQLDSASVIVLHITTVSSSSSSSYRGVLPGTLTAGTSAARQPLLQLFTTICR